MSHQSHTEHTLRNQSRAAYEKCLFDEEIPENIHIYYVLRANQFIRAAGNRDPRRLSAEEISKILNNLGANQKLADWQFSQLVDAVRILLFKHLSAEIATQIDWSFWKSSSRVVSGVHSTTAREHTPDEMVYLRVKNSGGELAKIRKQHRQLIVRLVTEIRARGYAYRTEEAYEQWAVRYIAYCKGESPENTGPLNVRSFLHELVVSGNVSASTQNQALNALIFLYKNVLGKPLGQLEDFARSKRKKIVPVVMSRSEVKALLAELSGWQLEVASLLYGTGMRVMEALTLRVKDIDFTYERILVSQAKGKKDRFVPLPKNLSNALKDQIKRVRIQHQSDLDAGYGETSLPEALARKFPGAQRS